MSGCWLTLHTWKLLFSKDDREESAFLQAAISVPAQLAAACWAPEMYFCSPVRMLPPHSSYVYQPKTSPSPNLSFNFTLHFSINNPVTEQLAFPPSPFSPLTHVPNSERPGVLHQVTAPSSASKIEL